MILSRNLYANIFTLSIYRFLDFCFIFTFNRHLYNIDFIATVNLSTNLIPFFYLNL